MSLTVMLWDRADPSLAGHAQRVSLDQAMKFVATQELRGARLLVAWHPEHLGGIARWKTRGELDESWTARKWTFFEGAEPMITDVTHRLPAFYEELFSGDDSNHVELRSRWLKSRVVFRDDSLHVQLSEPLHRIPAPGPWIPADRVIVWREPANGIDVTGSLAHDVLWPVEGMRCSVWPPCRTLERDTRVLRSTL